MGAHDKVGYSWALPANGEARKALDPRGLPELFANRDKAAISTRQVMRELGALTTLQPFSGGEETR